jgi:divalent metal cation (Fe/Co/Zn/Cd) transporter
MVHDYGPGQRYASLHVEMDYRWDPMKCHSIIDDLERKCLHDHNIHLVIHYDPVVVGDVELEAMREKVTALLQGLDSRLSIHDFRMVKSDAHTKLVFDMAVPQELMAQKKAIKDHLDGNLSKLCGRKIYTVITFDLKT